jgi:pimeloyl-ACP methyl ester carboxylesterase
MPPKCSDSSLPGARNPLTARTPRRNTVTPKDPAGEQPTATATSEDGVPIAIWASGSGRPVLLVHGTTSDHSTFDELVPHLENKRRVYRYDRRGRGLSGDGPSGEPYRLELEFADLAAVVGHVVTAEGAPAVDVISHSFGAYVAMGAAAGQSQIRSLVAYSPGFGAEYPRGALDRIETAIGESDPDTALRLVFRDVIGMPPEDIQVLADSEVWRVRVAAAWSVVRECQADEAFPKASRALLATISLPVLVLSGERNVPAKRELAAELAKMIPGAELDSLSGEGHAAHHTAPAALASRCLRFFDETAGRTAYSGLASS